MNNLHSSKNNYRLLKSSRRNRFVPLVVIGACLLNLGQISSAIAGGTREYRGITQKKFNTCVRTDKTDQGFAKYKDGNSGKLELWAYGKPGIIGYWNDWKVGTLTYSFNPQDGTLNYRLDDKARSVRENQIWGGLNNTIRKCGGR